MLATHQDPRILARHDSREFGQIPAHTTTDNYRLIMEGHAKRSFSHTEAKALRAITCSLRELAVLEAGGMRQLPTSPGGDFSDLMRISTALRATALLTGPRQMLSTVTKHPPPTDPPRVLVPVPIRPNATYRD